MLDFYILASIACFTFSIFTLLDTREIEQNFDGAILIVFLSVFVGVLWPIVLAYRLYRLLKGK